MRLIDADAAKLAANDYVMFRCQLGGLVDVAEFLNDMPTVDAVEVVRCKDCIHSYDDLCGLCCTCGQFVDCVVQPEFYCADGKRKRGRAWSGIKSLR